MIITCQHCGESVEAKRKTKKFCSQTCNFRFNRGIPTLRYCRNCEKPFPVVERGDANRRHCSSQCAKNFITKYTKLWHEENPEANGKYRAAYLARHPGIEHQRHRERRRKIIDLLGGKCSVCDVANEWWLHVDYIPTTRGKNFRHRRHYAYISQNAELFRLLCANHHYELTLTGAIEGTDIVQ